MKKLNLLIFIFTLALFVSCSNEEIFDAETEAALQEEAALNGNVNGNANTNNSTDSTDSQDSDDDPNDSSSEDEPCFTTTLIAGQHHVAGNVSIDIDGDNLIITYTTNGDWDLGTTHLAIGNCENDWVPVNGAGNPIIGQFEYTEPTSATSSEVVYVIPLADFDLESGICFAAHAEVNGPTGGETAWAQGDEFAGRSWAMFVQTDLSDCGDDDGGYNGPY